MKKILIVEDDLNLGTTLAGVLESNGYEVRYLKSGLSVMQIIKDFQPDIVLMDVILNEKSDGFDIAQKIRSKYPTPIIFTTSSDGNTDFNKGFSISNTDYVRKPYKIIEVMKRMERLFENTQSIFTFKLNKYTFIPAERALKFAYGNICLNHLESCVLTLLCEKPGIFISRNEITQKAWNITDPKLKEKSLNNILSNLRKYLVKDHLIESESKSKLGVRILILPEK